MADGENLGRLKIVDTRANQVVALTDTTSSFGTKKRIIEVGSNR